MARQIVNITSNYRVDYETALMAIEACSAKWVEEGKSIRRLTESEAITARNEQARKRNLRDLPYAEVPGLRFDPPATGIDATKAGASMVWAAHDWVARAA
jgi:hypothetical protein